MCCVQNDHVCVAVRNDWKMVVTALWVVHNDDIGMPIDVALVSLFFLLPISHQIYSAITM